MTVSGQQLAVGLRRTVVFELDANGYPAATGTTAYEGFETIGPKAFALTVPDVRKVVHVGSDRVIALDFLPSIEPSTAELTVAAQDMPLSSVLGAVEDFAVGTAKMMPWQTDQQGYEPDVAALMVQQSLDATTKLRHWRFFIAPKARAIPVPAGMDDNPAVMKYSLAPNPTTKHLWGTTMVVGTEGATEAGFIEGMSQGRPNIVAFKGNNSETDFLFPAGKQAIPASVVVWKAGVLQTITTHYTATASTLSFVAAPATDAMVVVFYEY